MCCPRPVENRLERHPAAAWEDASQRRVQGVLNLRSKHDETPAQRHNNQQQAEAQPNTKMQRQHPAANRTHPQHGLGGRMRTASSNG